MAIYKVVITKLWNGVPFAGEKWTNVYNVNEVSADDAADTGVAIGVLEMSVSYTPIIITGIVAFDPGNTADKSVRNPGSIAALSPTGLGGPVPLFNTTRVVLADALKSKEQKYLRLGANVDNVENGQWSGDFVDFVQSTYADDLAGLPSLCGPGGEAISAATVLAAIQMRQLGWSRRSRPGFHRGYVPN